MINDGRPRPGYLGLPPPVDEGFLALDEGPHRVFYRVFGSGGETILGLHGGPGADHSALARLAELSDEFRVVLYDQLGGGRSDRPDNPALWTIPRYVEEVESVRRSLELGPVHVLGRSWGGMLALEHALAHPASVRSLVLSNTGASTRLIMAGMDGVRREAGPEAYAALRAAEADGDLTRPEYLDIVAGLLARHYLRISPFDLERGTAAIKERVLPGLLEDRGPPKEVMWGSSEFLCTGTLRDWSVADRLGELAMPTLVLCGLHDEVTLDVHRALADDIAHSEFVIFGHSSHTPLFEREAELYLAVVRDFVRRAAATALARSDNPSPVPAREGTPSD